MIKVLLVDDHELVRTGIRRLLEDIEDIEVCSEASSGEEALNRVAECHPDVVLMDLSMPGIGGLETTRKLSLNSPDVAVIIVTVHTDAPFPSRLMQAGAMGYLSKGGSLDEMLQAIREVKNGGRYISPNIAQNLALSLMDEKESPFSVLSERELQVMFMLIQGQKVASISEKLNLSPKTISTYRHRVFEKLKVQNDAGLTRLAMCHGLLDGYLSSNQ
ncbi:UvrY/SirA/GacA family response regulator transcription factor [Thiohalomonas denitrificans]|uniref:UvrY/SirA/GacA family response regulator transcription factor n=1 Tax=Thiohalomonas denitrificans TaxID=415747 RepID=UPI0026EB1731|nr:UvrY/SirA/GacA family response regulator transcription factor [Thiohalomonas denitrificans]